MLFGNKTPMLSIFHKKIMLKHLTHVPNCAYSEDIKMSKKDIGVRPLNLVFL